MIRINWDDYKEYKCHSNKEDNFEILLDFFKSFYNLSNPYDIYDSLAEDGLGKMMLEKRDINDAEDMENYLLKIK
jgi:hypothetical protein